MYQHDIVTEVTKSQTKATKRIINPRCACAARVTVLGLRVCVCVCLQAGSSAIPMAQAQQGLKKLCGDFAKTAAFERYGVKTGDKATYLHRLLPIQAQWSIGSFTMERRECSNDNSVSANPWCGYTVGSS